MPPVSDLHQVHLVIDGYAEWQLGSSTLQLSRGMLALAPGSCPIQRKCPEYYDHSHMVCRFFMPGCNDLLEGLDHPIHIHTFDSGFMDGIDDNFRLKWMITGALRMNLPLLLPDVGDRIKRLSLAAGQFEGAVSYVENSLSAELQVKEVARAQNMQRTAFSRAFRQAMGISPKKYIDMRLNRRICDQLITTEDTLSEIAESNGFQDEYYFNRFFKRMNGTPPGQFRRNLLAE